MENECGLYKNLYYQLLSEHCRTLSQIQDLVKQVEATILAAEKVYVNAEDKCCPNCSPD